MKKCLIISILLIGFNLSSQNNLITNSSFSNTISDRTWTGGPVDEWFTINGDINIAQTAEGTLHLKSNNTANAIIRYKLDPTKFTAGKSYKLLFDAIALGVDTDLTKGLTFQLRKVSGTGTNNDGIYHWYDANSNTGTGSLNGALYSASALKNQAQSNWGSPRPWSTRVGANFTIPVGTDLSLNDLLLTFIYNSETNAPADATSGWYIDNVSITEIPADTDGVIVEDGNLNSQNRRLSTSMPYSTNYWHQVQGVVQVFADRDADNNITQTALMVAAGGSNGIARKRINNLTANKNYILRYKIKATEGKTYTKGANVRMKINDAGGTDLDDYSDLITVGEFNAAASDPNVDFIEKEFVFNSLNNTELIVNLYHGDETDASLADAYIYIDDIVVEDGPALELKGVLDFSTSWPGTFAKAIHLVATGDIADLSTYGLGIANNGGGTDGLEYTLPIQAATSGDHILIVSDQSAIDCYMNASSIFDTIIVDSFAGGQNGDDAIELFFNNAVIETFGDINCDPNASGTTCPEWEYTDTWAYKDNTGTWTYGVPNSTDNTETMWDVSDAANIYPAAVGQETATGINVGVIGSFVGWANDIDMSTTNNKFYHLDQYYLRAGDELKVRQDDAYTIQWDNGAGGNVAVTSSGFYDIVLNTCADAIELNSSTFKDQNISIVTSADTFASDIAMSTTDGIIYTLQHTFSAGEELKFRRDGSWDSNWGDNAAADGTADFNSADNISAPGEGLYNIEFNLENLNYVFNEVDQTPPVITLIGDPVVELNVGDTYTEEGATAFDEVDLDISANIVIAGDTVDTSTAGQYIVTYNVSDTAGNAATEVTRTVNVSSVPPLIITVSSCMTINELRLTGPFWSWNPTGGPIAVNNGDGTHTFTFETPPTAEMQYLLVADGVQENLIDNMVNGGSCAPVTDNANYANRQWNPGDGDVSGITYGQCGTVCSAPVITLAGDNPLTLSVGDTYTEPGVDSVTDDEDTIANSEVTVDNSAVDTATVGSYTVTYTVSDGAGNESSTTRTVDVLDTEAPVITLIGDPIVELTVGDTYTEEGATATDNIDGDISANISIAGDTVDTSTAGQYIVTYNVSDAAGNAAVEVTRTVNVSSVPPLIITVSSCMTINELRLTGPFWSWNPTGGPIAVNNGDGTHTFTFETPPTAEMQYLLVADGVQENLIDNMVNGGSCAPVTDNANYANRQWNPGDGDVSGITYGQCGTVCSAPAITLAGDNPLTLSVGDTYTEPGVDSVTDDEDTIANSEVTIDNSAVDTATAGTYTVTYTVSDGAGNEGFIARSVVIEALSNSVFDTFNFSFRPNPATNAIQLKANQSINQIVIYNLTGQKTLDLKTSNSDVVVDVSSLSNGIYLMEVSIANTSKIFRIVKQ